MIANAEVRDCKAVQCKYVCLLARLQIATAMTRKPALLCLDFRLIFSLSRCKYCMETSSRQKCENSKNGAIGQNTQTAKSATTAKSAKNVKHENRENLENKHENCKNAKNRQEPLKLRKRENRKTAKPRRLARTSMLHPQTYSASLLLELLCFSVFSVFWLSWFSRLSSFLFSSHFHVSSFWPGRANFFLLLLEGGNAT